MINNCPKCGNPLQEGITSCPICGTNIDINANSAATPVVAQVATPVVEQPVAPQVAVQPTIVQTPAAPVVETPQVVETTVVSAAQPEMQVVAPVVEQPVAPQVEVAPVEPVVAPVVETPVVQIVQPEMQVAPSVLEQPTVAPVQTVSAQTTEQTAIAPEQTVQTQMPTPVVPIMPTLDALAPKNEGVQIATPTAQPEQVVEKQEKKKTSFNIKNLTKNQKIIAVAAVAVVIMIVAGLFLSSSSLGKPTNVVQNNTPTKEVAVAKEVTTNGYKLKLEEGWMVEENGTDVILKKEDDSVIINIQHFAMSLEDFTKEKINSYFTSQTSFSDVNVEETSISGKNAYVINCTFQAPSNQDAKYPVQYYYINGGSSLIVGASIVYIDEDAKTSNAAFVTNLMGTMSYSDDTVKALDTLNMYSEVFGKYGNALKESSTQTPPSIEINPNENTTENEQNNDIPITID